MWDTSTASRGDPNGRHASKPRKEKNNIETKTNSNDMKRIPATLLWASSLLLLLPAASCTDTLGGDPDTDARAITFTPAAETRAAVDDADDMADGFKVWGWYDTDKNVFNGNTVSNTSGAWTYDGGTQYWIKGKTYNFYGVYPANVPASVDPNGTITVTGFDCSATGTNAVDLMTATHTRTYDGTNANAVNMPFQHELARVKVSVESNGATVDGLKVYGVGYKGNFNSTGTPSKWTVTGTATEGNTLLSETTELDMLLLPVTELTNAMLKVTYYYGSDASATRTDEASLAIAGGWAAGQQYHYKVSIVAGKLTITVTVVEWNEEDTSVKWE